MDTFHGFPRIEGIIYSEFHHLQGPKVIHEVPEGFQSTILSFNSNGTTQSTSPVLGPLTINTQNSIQNIGSPRNITSPSIQKVMSYLGSQYSDICEDEFDFDSISEYIIPKPEICNRLVIISTRHYKVVGYPVSIKDQKYERNALLFNMCFVFKRIDDVSPFIPIIKKMAGILKYVEVLAFSFLQLNKKLECEYISQPETKECLLHIMEQLMEDLNNYSECQIPINRTNTINLKLFPKYRDPPEVFDHQVPVCIINLNNIVDRHWDLTMRRVLPLINGVDCVRRISENSNVQHNLVKLCIRHLLYYGCIKMIDIFRFSNIYAPTSQITHLLRNGELQKELIDFVNVTGTPSVSFCVLFSFYSSLKYGQTIKQWIQENEVFKYRFDIRRFIVFGVIKGFIYRVHSYPCISESGHSACTSDLKRYLNGDHSLDEICVLFSCTPSEFDEFLRKSNTLVYYLRK